jgi:hypothetical protein
LGILKVAKQRTLYRQGVFVIITTPQLDPSKWFACQAKAIPVSEETLTEGRSFRNKG